MSNRKWLAVFVSGVFFLAIVNGEANAQKSGSRGSSRSSSSRSSGSLFGGSKPSRSSGSLFGGSKPSPSSKPSTSSKSLFGGSKSNSTSSVSKSKPGKSSGPKFGSTNSTIPANTPKFGSPNTNGSKTAVANSAKPNKGQGSSKAQAQKREESRLYVESKKATTAPKTSATVNGRTVKVDAGAKQVNDLRSRSSSYIAPQARRDRYVTHVTSYHYAHPYDYYYSRPVSYGIGPYSNAFWWMMSEWSADRRARWLYNHQSELSSQAYADAIRDREVQNRLATLEAQNVVRNASYVDPEFAANPSDAYDQAYVEAAYNPTVAPASVPSNGPSIGKMFLILVGLVVVASIVFAGFTVKVGK